MTERSSSRRAIRAGVLGNPGRPAAVHQGAQPAPGQVTYARIVISMAPFRAAGSRRAAGPGRRHLVCCSWGRQRAIERHRARRQSPVRGSVAGSVPRSGHADHSKPATRRWPGQMPASRRPPAAADGRDLPVPEHVVTVFIRSNHDPYKLVVNFEFAEMTQRNFRAQSQNLGLINRTKSNLKTSAMPHDRLSPFSETPRARLPLRHRARVSLPSHSQRGHRATSTCCR